MSTGGVTRAALGWVEQGLVPDGVVRAGIRRLCEARLADIGAGDCERSAAATERFIESMNRAPIALLPDRANEQHYEVPAAILRAGAGPAPQVQLCALARGHGKPGRGGSGGPRDHLRTGAARRRAGRARAGLRLGLAHALDGRALSRQPDHSRVELGVAARLDRVRMRATRPRQRSRADRRHERLPAAADASTASSRSRCSSTCATGAACSAA